MMGQMDLLTKREKVTKYQRHSETSRQAARDIEATAETVRGRVYRYLRSLGRRGATDEQIQNATKLNPSTQRPRRVELVEKGLIVASNQTRKTTSGRTARVWIVRD